MNFEQFFALILSEIFEFKFMLSKKIFFTPLEYQDLIIFLKLNPWERNFLP